MYTPSDVDAIGIKIASKLNNPDRQFWQALFEQAKEMLESFQRGNDEHRSNACWFLETVCETRGRFIDAISAIRDEQYFVAWCELERVEIGLLTLLRNAFLDASEFEIAQLLDLTQSWQKIYPYKWFMSPEILHKSVQCSICLTEVNPWSDCNHEPGIVYNGTFCSHIVTDLEFLSVSIVEDPVQKYSAIHIRKDQSGRDVEIYTYETVRFVIDRLASPFDRFSAKWIKVPHAHELFPNRTPAGPCPCECGRSYASCCMRRNGVLRPHLQIVFEKEPKGELPNVELVGFGDQGDVAEPGRGEAEEPGQE